MNNKVRELRIELKKRIESDGRLTPFLLLVTTILLPILECVLVNLWTGAQLSGPAGLCLAVVGLIHLVIGGVLVLNEFKFRSPLRVLADAAELADSNCNTQRELDRRVICYRMFRDSIETMNKQVCNLPGSPEGFDTTLRPVLKQFIESICTTLGVCSNRYTLEVYLREDVIDFGQENPNLCGYRLAFYESPTIEMGQALSMDTSHPLCLASVMDKEKMMGRASADGSVFGGDTKKPYFEQYATHMIPTECGTGHLGFVVFTTPQNEAIATDALETIGLIASVISTFFSRWQDCRRARLQAEFITNLQTQAKQMAQHVRQLQSRGFPMLTPNTALPRTPPVTGGAVSAPVQEKEKPRP